MYRNSIRSRYIRICDRVMSVRQTFILPIMYIKTRNRLLKPNCEANSRSGPNEKDRIYSGKYIKNFITSCRTYSHYNVYNYFFFYNLVVITYLLDLYHIHICIQYISAFSFPHYLDVNPIPTYFWEHIFRVFRFEERQNNDLICLVLMNT